MIGSSLSHFKITTKLGEGGMGVVWGAEDVDLHRPVALKVLSTETMARDDMRARFMREARTAAALNHPNICTIYEVGEVDQVPFIAMERIEGSGLDARLSEAEPLPLKELVRIEPHIPLRLDLVDQLGAEGARHQDAQSFLDRAAAKDVDIGAIGPIQPHRVEHRRTAIPERLRQGAHRRQRPIHAAGPESRSGQREIALTVYG